MAQLYRVTHTYSLATGAERAANSLYLLDLGAPAPMSSIAAAVSATTAAYWTALQPQFPTGVTVQRIRLDLVDLGTGLTSSGVDLTAPSTAGTGGATSVPLQCSPVCTLRTASSGARFRGRLFLPPITSSSITGTQGRMQTSARDALCVAVGNWMNALRAGGLPLQPVVYSRVGRSTAPITQVEVGDVLDTMRSRRYDLVEQRKTQVLV